VLAASDDRLVLAQIPADIVAVRAADNAVAIAWRDAFASSVGAALERGARVLGITPDLAYVLDRAIVCAK
jgi:predicted GNAT superfamily acetyltransferase